MFRWIAKRRAIKAENDRKAAEIKAMYAWALADALAARRRWYAGTGPQPTHCPTATERYFLRRG